MRPSIVLIALGLEALALAGCANWAIDMAPGTPDRPWTPATSPGGEIIAGERPSEASASKTYVLPPNQSLANIPPASGELERSRPYSLPELIDIAQSRNPPGTTPATQRSRPASSKALFCPA